MGATPSGSTTTSRVTNALSPNCRSSSFIPDQHSTTELPGGQARCETPKCRERLLQGSESVRRWIREFLIQEVRIMFRAVYAVWLCLFVVTLPGVAAAKTYI